MEFIETLLFTERIMDLLPDEDYANLQAFLMENPQAGALIPAGGGLRKLRWKIFDRGKSGGIRIIYYLWSKNKLIMITAYSKLKQEHLTADQLRVLREIMKGGVL